jgi:hypothetical protein
MKIKRKREIVAERERRVTIRWGSFQPDKFCPTCNGASPFVAVDQAAVIGGTTSLAIYRAIKSGQVHWLETSEGILIVCLASIETADREKEK